MSQLGWLELFVVVVAAFPPRILNITTPQVGHLPLIAFRPFFMVSSTASAISFFALHFTQYPSGIKLGCTTCFRHFRAVPIVYEPHCQRQLGKSQFYATR